MKFVFLIGLVGSPWLLPLSTAAQTGTSQQVFTVFSLNIWQEGTSVEGGFEKIVAVIAAADADLVALCEVRNYDEVDFHGRLVDALADRGHSYYGVYAGGDTGLLSRWPIVKAEPMASAGTGEQGGIQAYFLDGPGGQPVLLASAHLDYLNYATYLPRGYDGNSFKVIDTDGDGEPDPVTDLAAIHAMDKASTRDESLDVFLRYLEKPEVRGLPVILAGDFNECSYLDWVAATKDRNSHNGVVIEWANSKRLADHGFVDAWREVFPDPVTHPGATWPSEAWGKETTTWTPKAEERDRIDFIYHNGEGMEAVRAWVVGSPRYHVRDQLIGADSDCPFLLSDLPWPSDHKGVMAEFAFTPKRKE